MARDLKLNMNGVVLGAMTVALQPYRDFCQELLDRNIITVEQLTAVEDKIAESLTGPALGKAIAAALQEFPIVQE